MKKQEKAHEHRYRVERFYEGENDVSSFAIAVLYCDEEDCPQPWDWIEVQEP